MLGSPGCGFLLVPQSLGHQHQQHPSNIQCGGEGAATHAVGLAATPAPSSFHLADPSAGASGDFRKSPKVGETPFPFPCLFRSRSPPFNQQPFQGLVFIPTVLKGPAPSLSWEGCGDLSQRKLCLVLLHPGTGKWEEISVLVSHHSRTVPSPKARQAVQQMQLVLGWRGAILKSWGEDWE